MQPDCTLVIVRCLVVEVVAEAPNDSTVPITGQPLCKSRLAASRFADEYASPLGRKAFRKACQLVITRKTRIAVNRIRDVSGRISVVAAQSLPIAAKVWMRNKLELRPQHCEQS